MVARLAAGRASLPLLLLVLGVVACGGNNPTNKTAPTSVASAPPSVSATAAATAAAVGSPAAGAQPLQEITTDNKFSATTLRAKAGVPIALTITNHGQAIHNWHLLDATDTNARLS